MLEIQQAYPCYWAVIPLSSEVPLKAEVPHHPRVNYSKATHTVCELSTRSIYPAHQLNPQTNSSMTSACSHTVV